LTPFLPHSSQQVHELLGGTGTWSVAPEVHEVTDLDDGSPYPIITGPYEQSLAVWASTPLAPPGTPMAAPTPIFTKLDPSVVEEEIRRLEDGE
jgi:methionyl-tRNA synthetase